MDARKTVEAHLQEIRLLAEGKPAAGLHEMAKPVLNKLLGELTPPKLPETLLAAPDAGLDDYHANWNHQLWYHLAEIIRIVEGRKQRAESQGGDSWANVSKPEVEQELQNHFRELAKVGALIDSTPELVQAEDKETIFADARLDNDEAWERPRALQLERDAAQGVCWQGQHPGGDWFWLKQRLGDDPISIRFELYPVSTIVGGLIAAFAATPLRADTPLSAASSPRMSDYYKNFDAYHFSVNRGGTGYCNLRRTGPGLIMLASFSDPCPEYGKWYALEIVKNGPQIELRADGKLAVCYVDLGYIQPCLGGGYFGLRHFQGFRGWHRNVMISSLQ